MHPLYAHQRDFLDKHAFHEFHGLFWEQGTGKTRALIENALTLYEADKIDGVLVLAPPGVERNWVNDELPTHLPPEAKAYSRMHLWQSSKAKRKAHVESMAGLLAHKGLAWLAMTYPAFSTETAKLAVWHFLKKRRVLFVCDEAMGEGGIKTPGGVRSKSVVAAGKYAPYRRIADRTPVAEGPFDFFAPVRFLDQDYWKRAELAPFSVYKNYFAEFKQINGGNQNHRNGGFDKFLGYRNLDELNLHLRTVGSRVLKEDCLDLPEKVYLPPWRFDMTDAQRRMYDQLVAEYKTRNVDDVTADLPIVRLQRLQQIVCGYLPASDEDATLTPIMPPSENPRLHLMEEMRSRNRNSKSIVWCRYQQDVQYLMDLLPNAVRYDGTITDDEAERNKNAFQHGDAEWFISTLSKGSTGLTLHSAKHVIYYSNSFRLRQRLQSEDRAHRAGLKHVVDYADVLASETVDEGIIASLRSKNDIATTITGDKLREWI